jgi:hypothetical protein
MNALSKRPSTPDPLQASSAPRHCQPETRIVAVPVPRFDSAAGRVFVLLEANPRSSFTPEHIARMLKIDPELARQGLNQLRSRGLVTALHQGRRRQAPGRVVLQSRPRLARPDQRGAVRMSFAWFRKRAVTREIIRSEFAETVAVGFPVNRPDGLMALYVGGSHTLLDAGERARLRELLGEPSCACAHVFHAVADAPANGVTRVCVRCAKPRWD